MFRHGRAEARLALHVLLPAILLVLVFRIFPLFWGFAISLTSATSTDPGEFVGAANDLRALDDPNFRASIANAGVVALHPHLRNAADAAGDPDRPGRSGRTLFRSVYFFPVVLFSVIIGSIFSVVLGFNGSFNASLKMLGPPPVDWLGHSATALAVTLVIQSWSTFGMGVLIFLRACPPCPVADDELIAAAAARSNADREARRRAIFVRRRHASVRRHRPSAHPST